MMMLIKKKCHVKKAGGLPGCCCKMIGRLFGFAFLTFAVTFCIYMFNLENKLLYYVVRPFLNRHYDSQNRDRRI
jgi:hypothetical protein